MPITLAQANVLLRTLPLPTGMTLAGEAVLQAGRIMVPVADKRRQQSYYIAFESLVPSKTPFNTPSVFRPAAAIAPVETCEDQHDASLDACFDPSDPDNLDEILRQTASNDPTQREEGHIALQYAHEQAKKEGPQAESRLKGQISAAYQKIVVEHPEEAPKVAQTYQSFMAGPMTDSTPSEKGGIAESTKGPVESTGVDTAASSLPGIQITVKTASFGDEEAKTPSETVGKNDTPPISSPISSNPLTFDQLPAWIGQGSIPHDGPRFFTNLFIPPISSTVSEGRPVPPIVDFLISDSPEAHPYVGKVQRAAANVLWNHWSSYRTNGRTNGGETAGAFVLVFDYDTKTREVVVSLKPTETRKETRKISPTFVSLDLVDLGDLEDAGDNDFGPFPLLQRRFASLPVAAVLWKSVDDMRREAGFSAYPQERVPVPLEIVFWTWKSNPPNRANPTVVRHEGGTKEPVASRDDSGNHQGREDGGHSRDGRNRNRDNRREHDEDEEDSAA